MATHHVLLLLLNAVVEKSAYTDASTNPYIQTSTMSDDDFSDDGSGDPRVSLWIEDDVELRGGNRNQGAFKKRFWVAIA